jgi:hypothetical protein
MDVSPAPVHHWYYKVAASSSSSMSRRCLCRSSCALSNCGDLRGQVLNRGERTRCARVPVGDLFAEGSRQSRLQAANLLLRFAGLVLGGFHLDPERRGTQRRLAAQSGDEPRWISALARVICPLKWLLTNDRCTSARRAMIAARRSQRLLSHPPRHHRRPNSQ